MLPPSRLQSPLSLCNSLLLGNVGALSMLNATKPCHPCMRVPVCKSFMHVSAYLQRNGCGAGLGGPEGMLGANLLPMPDIFACVGPGVQLIVLLRTVAVESAPGWLPNHTWLSCLLLMVVILCRGEGAALSLEGSRQLLQQSGKEAQAAADMPERGVQLPISAEGIVRCLALGMDQDARRFWQLQGWSAAMQSEELLLLSQSPPQTPPRGPHHILLLLRCLPHSPQQHASLSTDFICMLSSKPSD